MPIAAPDTLDSFMLGGYKLQAMAPQQLRDGVNATFKFFFFKKGKTIAQEGRVIPKPIALEFRYNGAGALQAALFLKQMARKQLDVKLSWAKAFSYNGKLTEFEFTATQKLVTGTLTYQPTEDYLQHDNAGALTTNFQVSADPAEVTATAKQSIFNVLGALDAMNAGLQNLQSLEADAFGPVFDFIDQANTAVGDVSDAIYTFGDILSMPFDTASSLYSTLQDALGLIPGAYSYIVDTVFDPIAPFLSGTEQYLADAWGQSTVAGMDDAEVNMNVLSATLAPEPLTYTAIDTDTVTSIAQLFGVTVEGVLSLNPGLTSSNLTAGSSVKIPPNAQP